VSILHAERRHPIECGLVEVTEPLPKPPPRGATTMRFMILVKSSPEAEAGVLPDEAALSEMGRFNEEMEKAGVMLAGEGLEASAKGTRVRIAGGRTTVLDGPFAEAKELVAGYWLVDVGSKEEAIEWAKRAPFREGEVEVRQLYELSDFVVDPAQTPGGWREQEERLRSGLDVTAGAAPLRKPGTSRYMVFIMADENTEAGMPANEALLTEMGALMEELANSGALLAGEGLQPTSKGTRVRYAGDRRTVVDGPFTEAKELVAGFTLIQVPAKEEAIELARRCLQIHIDGTGIDHGQIEVRRVMELSEFPVDSAEDPEGWRAVEQRIHDRQYRSGGS
jgi:hypothetical protein